ncbi:MAG: type IV secretory pathway protein [Candidatus Aenigmarchaeota archaeon]|nr:type IV secretory pathway protein [Candidatus Aenigmarchaeota archaeon]
MEPGAIEKLKYYLVRDLINYGKIDPFMHDYMVEDISCDGPDIPVYIWHRQRESIPTNVVFEENDLNSFIVRLAYLAGKHINIANPMLDASLPDGSRIQLTYEREVTRKGSTFTIRRFRADPLTVSDLISLRTLSPELAAWFWVVMERKTNILIGGGTASGKTTTLNSLSAFFPPDDKIITIEDTAELNIPHQNWISSVVRSGFGVTTSSAEITLFDLLKAAMRQRPDYIIVGEVRGDEAYTLFQAMATGHGGLSSIHCDSAMAALNRLESAPMNIPRTLMPTLNVIGMQTKLRMKDMSVRKVSHVVEIVGLDPVSKEVLTNEVFRWDPSNDFFTYSGRSIVIESIAERYGLKEEGLKEELLNRRHVLEWMVKKKIRKYDKVGAVVREYYADPEKVSNKAKVELGA